MSNEKIDLAGVVAAALATGDDMFAHHLLSLVRAVRAAKEFVEHQAWLLGYPKMQPLRDALAPFTDSAEVRRDD